MAIASIMSINANETATVSGNKQLHPAMFLVPIVIAAVAAIPSVFVLLMLHAFTGLLGAVLHHQISLFDTYFYLLVFTPAIVLSVTALVIVLAVYRKSMGKRVSRCESHSQNGREADEVFHPQISQIFADTK